MGCSRSKSAEEPEEATEETSNNPSNIYYDEDGNLKHGGNTHDRDDELHKILQVDDATEENGKLWYIIDDAWATSWLAFVSLGKHVSPAPGPIKNMQLLVANYDEKRFQPREGLVMSGSDRKGHYKRITKDAWDLYCEFYPDSGPEIKFRFYEDPSHKLDGKYNTSNWIIDQSGFSKYEEENPSHKHHTTENAFFVIEDKKLEEEDKKVELSDETAVADGSHSFTSSGRMEDNSVTEEQKRNLEIFLGSAKVEENLKPSTTMEVYNKLDKKPQRTGRTMTSDLWLFGSAPGKPQ